MAPVTFSVTTTSSADGTPAADAAGVVQSRATAIS
jgi:hypothetical protein